MDRDNDWYKQSQQFYNITDTAQDKIYIFIHSKYLADTRKETLHHKEGKGKDTDNRNDSKRISDSQDDNRIKRANEMNSNELSKKIVKIVLTETYKETKRFQEFVNQDNNNITKFQATIRLIIYMQSAEKMLERLNERESDAVIGLIEIVKDAIKKSMDAGVIIEKKWISNKYEKR